MNRAIVVVSRVYGVYPWRYHQAEQPDWFERRMRLLQRITLPALARVDVPFVWVWQAHKTKMHLVATQLQGLDLQGIHVRLVDQNAMTHPDIWPNVEKFLTFRIDTDDAWLPAAIDQVSSRAFSDQTLVDFYRGVVLDWKSSRMFHRNLISHQGPFLALTQDRDRMLDTGGPHREARRGRIVAHIDDISWVQVVHGGNAINRLPPRPSRKTFEREGPDTDGAAVCSELYEQIIASSGIQLE